MSNMKSLVILRESGGIGNQFFLYTFYLHLSKKFPDRLFLFDKSPYYRRFSKRRNELSLKWNTFYRLHHFFHVRHLNRLLAKVLYRLGKLNKAFLGTSLLPIALTESDLKEAASLFSKYRIVVISGHFISPQYIADNLPELRRMKEIEFPDPALMNKVLSTESVSVHLRGGHYIEESDVAETYAPVTANYYRNAIRYMKTRLKNPHFFIFSNSETYAQSFFPTNKRDLTVVKGYPDYLDFYLMSKCRHNIVINSTFSYFASLLNGNEDKIVICPQKWSGEKVVNNQDGELPENSWIRLPN